MAGMFDQFEQAAQKCGNNNTWNPPGYINMKLEQNVPIFSKTKMNFTPSGKITHVAISNHYLVIAMTNSMLFRMNLQNPKQQDEINISKYITNKSRLRNLFLDPTGNHLLIAFSPLVQEVTPELVYLSSKSTKLRPTTKFRGHDITEVGWNSLNESETTTGPILLGTSKGLIFETEIIFDGDKFFTPGFSSSVEQYWRQVFDIGKGSDTPITGIEFNRIPNVDQYFIFVTTPNRLYYFKGRTNVDEKSLLQQVFSKYLNIPEKQTYEEKDTKLRYSKLKFWSENLIYPQALGWLIESEVVYGEINPSEQDDINAIKKSLRSIQYPKPLYDDCSGPRKPPIALVLTQFHVLLAYTDTIKGVSLLNKEVVYEDNYNEAFGKLVNIVKDAMTGVIWAVTENAVFRFKVTKEERNVWQIYCENQQFDLAKKYSYDNPVNYNQVLIKEGDTLFDKGEYLISAQRYAEAHSSFEEVCLKFMEVDQQHALKTFLHKKMETLTPQEKTQMTLIVIWVVELYLNQLEELKIVGMESSSMYLELQREFQAFLSLSQVTDNIKANKSTIYNLMSSHGYEMNSLQLTAVPKDFKQLIRQHIYKNNFLDALDVLKKQNNKELFYQFAPILIQEIPKYVIKALIDQGSNLVPVKLLPALISCNGELLSKEVIKYLEFCVNTLNNTDKAIHNLLISLYAKYEPEKLLGYLHKQGSIISMVNYDVHFALRLCQEHNLTKACMELSALLELWESAVDLALTIQVDLAKQYANMPPENDIEMRKKLWLKIAQHVISGKDNIEQAMEFLQSCDLLRIEDILPFFSDFVTIDHFKSAICSSLNEYNQHVQNMKSEMEEATQSAELVRKEIQSFRNRHTIIGTSDVCEVCGFILLVKPFYLFPCNHKIHMDCLLKELTPTLGPAKRNKLADLQRQHKILSSQINADNVSTGSSGISTKDSIRADIDNIIASECLYCGENMIRNIDLPFIDEEEYDRIMKEWD